jgi:FPC/CPF motif-containing protein YcgG
MRENPFATGNAKPPEQSTTSFAELAGAAFREFVARPEFPCLGAKAALNAEACSLHVFGELGSVAVTAPLARALYDFTESIAAQRGPHPSLLPQGEGTGGLITDAGSTGNGAAALLPLPEGEGRVRATSEYSTCVAIFEHPVNLSELEFEGLLWQQLRALHQHDAPNFVWGPNVKSDPADPHFSFSFGGHALYVIGMHANSSREARRFPWPAMVFNPHEQFERLRADGNWKRMQETIRSRDLALQGSINPMLSDFGEQSEARQYSGRAVEENWQAPFPKAAGKCPFHH